MCSDHLFCHVVITDAVMAVSGHFSTVMSVEVVPSVIAEGLRSEVPFLASEEGMEPSVCCTVIISNTNKNTLAMNFRIIGIVFPIGIFG